MYTPVPRIQCWDGDVARWAHPNIWMGERGMILVRRSLFSFFLWIKSPNSLFLIVLLPDGEEITFTTTKTGGGWVRVRAQPIHCVLSVSLSISLITIIINCNFNNDDILKSPQTNFLRYLLRNCLENWAAVRNMIISTNGSDYKTQNLQEATSGTHISLFWCFSLK